MINRILLCLAPIALTLPAHANPDWPALFRNAVSAPDSVSDMAYSYENVVRDQNGKELFRIGFDGAAPEADRVRLISISEELAKHKDNILESAREDGGDIWCDGLTENIKSGVTIISDTEEATVFGFQPTDPEADSNERKVLEKSKARLTIDKASGEIRKIEYNLEKPFKPVIVAKVHEFSVDAECKPTPLGRPYIASTKVHLKLSALGQTEIQDTVELIENLRFPGFPAE